MASRVMVTGGRGFIGTHLVDLLARNQFSVISVDMKDTPARPTERIVHVVGDIRDRHLMSDLFYTGKFDLIYDLASLTEIGLCSTKYQRNLEQTKAMLTYCAKYNVDKYIFYSSQFVFRKPDTLPASENDYFPIDYYGESKTRSEELIKSLLPKDKFLILRPTYIWGPGCERFRDGLLYRLLKQQMIIPSDPNLKRYFGYVETVVGQTLALSRLSFIDLPRKVYYISDNAITMDEFCECLLSALRRGKVWTAPAWFIRLLGSAGASISKCGFHTPIGPVQARELTTNFPVPIEPTLELTDCVTDLSSAAAKTVSWASAAPRFH
jgi:nucleoside-diphosphate-sugar epimerase